VFAPATGITQGHAIRQLLANSAAWYLAELAIFGPLVAMVLAGRVALGCAQANDAVGHESARGITDQRASTMKICMDLGGTLITATLDDNETSRDFVSLLPLTLTLTDYAATEKISDLPRGLSTQGSPSGSEPSIGDIAYYAPWGNLALFYRDAPFASGLVRLGVIDSNVDALRRTGSLSAKIDVVRP
jgi:hypothetical protein